MKKIFLIVLVVFQTHLKATDGEFAAARRAARNWCEKNWTNYPNEYTDIEQCTQSWLNSGHAEFLVPNWY